jgi:hypothetical protein
MLVKHKPLLGAIVGMGLVVTIFSLVITMLAILIGTDTLLLCILIVLFVLLVCCASLKCFGGKNEAIR